jgi:hypothetical protein
MSPRGLANVNLNGKELWEEAEKPFCKREGLTKVILRTFSKYPELILFQKAFQTSQFLISNNISTTETKQRR